MSVTTRVPKPWDAPRYQRIVAASHEPGTLVVRFADGTEARVAVTRLPHVLEQRPDWTALRCDEFAVVVPTAAGEFTIPWLPIRSLTDPEFRAYLDTAAVEGARQVGQRLRLLREEHGLSVAALAGRAGIRPSTLARIEQGDPEVALSIVRQVLEAMGHKLKDLMHPDVESLSEVRPA